MTAAPSARAPSRWCRLKFDGKRVDRPGQLPAVGEIGAVGLGDVVGALGGRLRRRQPSLLAAPAAAAGAQQQQQAQDDGDSLTLGDPHGANPPISGQSGQCTSGIRPNGAYRARPGVPVVPAKGVTPGGRIDTQAGRINQPAGIRQRRLPPPSRRSSPHPPFRAQGDPPVSKRSSAVSPPYRCRPRHRLHGPRHGRPGRHRHRRRRRRHDPRHHRHHQRPLASQLRHHPRPRHRPVSSGTARSSAPGLVWATSRASLAAPSASPAWPRRWAASAPTPAPAVGVGLGGVRLGLAGVLNAPLALVGGVTGCAVRLVGDALEVVGQPPSARRRPRGTAPASPAPAPSPPPRASPPP